MQLLFQSERSECGLVALAMLASNYGLQTDLPSLRARYPVSVKGLTLRNLIEIARHLELDTRVVRCEMDNIDQLQLPVILHWEMNHFVVLAERRGRRFIIYDPAIGKVTLSKEEMNTKFTGIVLEAWPGPKFRKSDQRQRLKLGTVLPKHRAMFTALASIFVLALGIEGISLIVPILQQLIIDDALLTADTDLLTLVAVAMIIFLIGQAATTATRGMLQRNLTSTLSLIIPSRLFVHMMALPTSWFDQRSAADIANRFESGRSVQQTLTTSIVSAVIDGIVAVSAMIMMIIYNSWLALIVLATFAAYATIRLIWYSTYRQQSQGALVANAKVQSILWETMRGAATIKAFNGAVSRHGRYLSALSKYIRLQNGVTTANTVFTFTHDLLFAAESVAILYFGAKAVLAHQFSVGMLTAFMGFKENFASKGTNLVNALVEFRLLGIHLDRLSDILLSRTENATAMPFLGETCDHGMVEVRKISFRYGENEPDVLRNCSFKVEPREILAIIGPSGAGKSTLFKILAGQAEARTGEVLIDGIPTTSLGFDRLRDIIAVVRQDDMLFEGTIAENIAFLEEYPDHGRVRDVAKIARIHEEIQRMPMGYNTLIGTMGTGLSGGQTQRIMLARALYKSPRILLLDEATSHLDLDNERNVSLALRDIGVTQIIIAHRPETIAKADRVLDIRDMSDEARPRITQ